MVFAGVRKDRNKFQFFKRNADSRLSRTLMERFSGASLQQKRAFINEVVTRSDSGSWMFTIGGELFNEWQRAGSNVGLVTMGGREAAKQWGGYGMLAECKKRGEVWPVIRKGKHATNGGNSIIPLSEPNPNQSGR